MKFFRVKIGLFLVLFFLLFLFYHKQNIFRGLLENRFIVKNSLGLTLVEAMYYSKMDNNCIQCLLCPRKCVLREGQRGFCKARLNKNGKCYTLVYGRPIIRCFSVNQRSLVYCSTNYNMLRVGTSSCNLQCKFCFLSDISQAKPEELAGPEFLYSPEKPLSPQDIITVAKKSNCRIIAYTFNEPTIFYEYMLAIAKLAKKENLYNVLSTNGYINEEPLRELLKYMDGVSLGLKGFREDVYQRFCSAELEPVMKTMRILRDSKIGFEITYPIIPTVNDGLEEIKHLCTWIKENLGKDIPLHFIRYLPSYKLANLPPTSLEALEGAEKIARSEGLNCVYKYYLNEIPSPDLEEKIYCPNCKKLILYRKGGRGILVNSTMHGKCKFCGNKILFITLD